MLRALSAEGLPRGLRDEDDHQALLARGVRGVLRSLAGLRALELGLVRALHLEGEHHRYEIAGNGEHHHMICLGCGRVIEFECGHCAETHRDLAQQHNFEITGSQVQLLGYCADCQARGEGREE